MATCDVVVDVGGVYDPATQRYDHHQRGFTEVFGGKFDTKLSSAGLVYKYVLDQPLFLLEVKGKKKRGVGKTCFCIVFMTVLTIVV